MLERDLRWHCHRNVDAMCEIAAAIAGAASIGGALISSNGAQQAANTQASAANATAQEQLQAAQLAANTQLSMFNTTQSNLAPYMQTGSNALAQLANLWGVGPQGTGTPNAAAATTALTNFPGYQFGLDQGQQALDRSAASRGLLLSGAQLKDSQQFGQGYAQSQGWQPYVTGLSGLATSGQNAAAGVGTLGQSAASGAASAYQTGAANAGSAQLAGAQATAAGQIGSANSLSSGLQNALLSYQLYGGGAGGGASAPTVASQYGSYAADPMAPSY